VLGTVIVVCGAPEEVTLCRLPVRVKSIVYILSILFVCSRRTLFCLAKGPSGADRRRITSFVVFVDILITVSLMSAMRSSRALRRLSKSAEAAARFCLIPEIADESSPSVMALIAVAPSAVAPGAVSATVVRVVEVLSVGKGGKVAASKEYETSSRGTLVVQGLRVILGTTVSTLKRLSNVFI
jgi:hypothetical protein